MLDFVGTSRPEKDLRQLKVYDHLKLNSQDDGSALQLQQLSGFYSDTGNLSATAKSLEKSFGVRPALVAVSFVT